MSYQVLLLLLLSSGSCNGMVPQDFYVGDPLRIVWPGTELKAEWRSPLGRFEVASPVSWITSVLPKYVRQHGVRTIDERGLLSKICFTREFDSGSDVLRPATLKEIEQFLQNHDGDGKKVPPACLDAKASVRTAALAAGWISDDADKKRQFRGAANDQPVDLGSEGLHVAQREYAFLLGESEESVPLDQIIVLRRSDDEPRHSMLKELVAMRKGNIYEMFGVGYWNRWERHLDLWSDEFRNAFEGVRARPPHIVEGDCIVYLAANERPTPLDDIFVHAEKILGKPKSMAIDVQGRSYEWKPTTAGRFLNPLEPSDWMDGFSIDLDDDLARLFALAPWKSDGTGRVLSLQTDSACRMTNNEFSDVKAVALLIDKLDHHPPKETHEPRNVAVVGNQIFFIRYADDLDLMVSRICKNKMPPMLQQMEITLGDCVSCEFSVQRQRSASGSLPLSASGERRPRSGSGERRPRSGSGERRPRSGSSERRRKAMCGLKGGNSMFRLLLAMSRDGQKRVSRHTDKSVYNDHIDWRAISYWFKSEGNSSGFDGYQGVLHITLPELVEGAETEIAHLLNGFGDLWNEATSNLIKESFDDGKHFLVLEGGEHTEKSIRKLLKRLMKNKEGCQEKKPIRWIKEKGKSSFFVELSSEACLDSIFEGLKKAQITQLEDSPVEGKWLMLRMKEGLAPITDKAELPSSFDVYGLEALLKRKKTRKQKQV